LVNLGGTSLGIGVFTAVNAAVARASLGAAASGANADITSLTGLTTALSVAQGGTGQTSYTNGQLLIGNTTGNTLTKSTLTAGTGITVTNSTGSITIANTGPDTFPGVGIAYSTGTAWGTSYATSGTGTTIALSASPALTGTPTAPTATAGTNTTQIATTAYVVGTAFSSALPGQAGNAGKYVTTDGTTASWAFIPAGGISYTAVKTSNYSAAVNDGVQTDTSGGSFTVTLPATPAVGDQVIVTDSAGSWATNNLTVGRNGSTIEGTATDLICNISSVSVQLVYSGTTWDVFAQAGGAGGVIDINTQTTGTLTVPRGGTGATTLTGVVKGNGTSAMTAGTVTVAEGGTGATTLTANAVLVGNGTSAVASVAPGTLGNILTSNGTAWTSAAAPSNAVQYPQNSQAGNYTLVLGDAGKQIFHPASDPTPSTYTIPANSSVAFPIGTVVLFTAENGGVFVNVAITSDTLVFGNGTTGTVTVLPNNTLMAIKVTSTKWMANYLYQTGAPNSSEAVAVANGGTTPFITAYPWSSAGFGTKFANPTTLPGTFCGGVAFNPTGTAIAVGHNTSPFITAYAWSISGFGAKFADPATLPASGGNKVAFNSAGNAVAVCHDTTPFVSAYPWSGSGFGTKFADPATLPTTPGTLNDVAFNPNGTAVAVMFANTPFINVYAWSGSGFGTRFSNPSPLPTTSGLSVAFNPAGDAIALGSGGSPRILVYPWSGAGFGTKFTDPATLPTADVNSVAFSPSGNAIITAHTSSPFVTAYPWSGAGFGTKFTDPATLPTGNGRGVAFSTAGNAIAIAHDTTPFVTAYPWSGAGFGTKFTDPATLPTAGGRDVAFTNAG
jgi:hypothetical protein